MVMSVYFHFGLFSGCLGVSQEEAENNYVLDPSKYASDVWFILGNTNENGIQLTIVK